MPVSDRREVARATFFTSVIFLAIKLFLCCRQANQQFIQDRIRHLVDAFSTRAQAARERIETPATPSSVSSRETVDQSTIPTKPKLSISFSDKHIEDTPEHRSNKYYKPRRFFGKLKILLNPECTLETRTNLFLSIYLITVRRLFSALYVWNNLKDHIQKKPIPAKILLGFGQPNL